MTRTHPKDLSAALDHLERGDWRAAHEIVQRDERTFPAGAKADAEIRALRDALGGRA